MRLRLGLDIGATKTNILLIEPGGTVRARRRIMTDSIGSPDPIISKLEETVQDLLHKENIVRSDIESLGVGLAGQQDPLTGIVDNSPNLKWFGVEFRKPLEARLGMNVYMANDVNAAAWGEFCYGAGRKSRDMVAVFVGSGIGGGIVCNGRLVEGASGTAGEVGHVIFRENGLICDCGNKGCFEAYGGGVPMENRMRKAVRAGKSRLVEQMVNGKLDKINTATIYKAAQKGDAAASRIWADAEMSIGILCANLVSLMNPERIVLGGGVIEGVPSLLDTIQKIVSTRAVNLSAQRVQVVKSTLGSDAVALGAAAVADLYR